MGFFSNIPDWVNFFRDYTLLAVLLLLIGGIVLMGKKRDLFDEINLWLTGSDIMLGRAFAHFLARRLRKHKGDVIFYNIPLATLDSENDRRALWVDCLNRNHDLNLRLLLSPLQAKHLLNVRNTNAEVKEVLDVMGARLRVVVVEFPLQERANYGCVMLDRKGGEPLLVTASFTLRGFWNWDGNIFNCFLAFSPKRFHIVPCHVTSEMCESISSLAKGIVQAAQNGEQSWEFRYGRDLSDTVQSKMLPKLMSISELEEACRNEMPKAGQA